MAERFALINRSPVHPGEYFLSRIKATINTCDTFPRPHNINRMTSFEELYQTHFKSVYAYVFARVRNAAAAEDICASVWKKCYEHFASFDETKGVFGQWLFGIALN